MVATAKADLKIVRYFLAAGFLVPWLLFLVIVVGDVRIQGSWILVPWPTFPLIMSAEAVVVRAAKPLPFDFRCGECGRIRSRRGRFPFCLSPLPLATELMSWFFAFPIEC